MSAVAATAAQRLAVAEAIDTFVAFANANSPDGHEYEAEPSGSKYRIVQTYRGTGRAVHAFVDGDTGDLLKAAGWKVPAKGVRYNLLTEMDAVRDNFTWSGGYLYAGARK